MPMTSRTPSLSFEGYSVVDLYAKKSRKFQGHFCILYFFKKMFFKKWAIPGLFFSLFSSFQYTVDSKHMFNINKKFPMTGFEPLTSGIRSDRSTNWATTTALKKMFLMSTIDVKKSQQVQRSLKPEKNFALFYLLRYASVQQWVHCIHQSIL